MSGKKKPSPRAARRETERAAKKLTRDLERMATLEPGGAPERPIELRSAAEVEITARSIPCPRCRGEVRVDEHLAETIGAARLRLARVSCPACGFHRTLYFRLGSPLPN